MTGYNSELGTIVDRLTTAPRSLCLVGLNFYRSDILLPVLRVVIFLKDTSMIPEANELYLIYYFLFHGLIFMLLYMITHLHETWP